MITRELSVLEDDLISAFVRYHQAEKAVQEANKELAAAAKALLQASGQINFPHIDRLRAIVDLEKPR